MEAGLLVLVALYFTPTIVGAARKVTNIGSVFVINLFLGWSVIGWVVSLAMASRTVRPAPAPTQITVVQAVNPQPYNILQDLH